MANSLSAAKRARVSERRRQYNRMYRSRAKTLVKKCRAAIMQGDKEAALQAFAIAASALDRAANKGIIHRNKAARQKSRLARSLAQLG